MANFMRFDFGRGLWLNSTDGGQTFSDAVNGLLKGTLASRPDAGQGRRFYFATDTAGLFYDTGTTWISIGGVPSDIDVKTLDFLSEYDNGTVTTNTTIDWRNGSVQRVTLGGNVALSFSNIGIGRKQLRVIQDATGGRVPTLPSGRWPGGIVGSFSTDPNARDILNVYYDGAKYYYRIEKDLCIQVLDIDTTQADFQAGVLTNVEANAGGFIQLTKQFQDKDLYLPEVTGTGTVANAGKAFTAVDCTGLTKSNAYLQIELKCTDWSKKSGDTQIEITSSGTFDVEEWNYSPASLSITSNYQTFLIPLSSFGTSGGELVVSQIDFIRWYCCFDTSQTISWRNAKIIGKYAASGSRVSPQIDLSTIGVVGHSSVAWTGATNGQTITIETRVSTDGGANWSAWGACTNGGAAAGLSAGMDVSNGLLECKQTLSAADQSVTPRLEELTIKVKD